MKLIQNSNHGSYHAEIFDYSIKMDSQTNRTEHRSLMNYPSDYLKPKEALSVRTSHTQLAGKYGHGRKKMGGRYEGGIGPLIVYMGLKKHNN